MSQQGSAVPLRITWAADPLTRGGVSEGRQVGVMNMRQQWRPTGTKPGGHTQTRSTYSVRKVWPAIQEELHELFMQLLKLLDQEIHESLKVFFLFIKKKKVIHCTRNPHHLMLPVMNTPTHREIFLTICRENGNSCGCTDSPCLSRACALTN